MKSVHPVSIILPVYADWPSLKVCLDALMQHIDTDVHRVLLINDAGPKASELEVNIKHAITGQKNYYYYSNKLNLGFLGNCNHAVLDVDKTNNDILLLNSDTQVTAGFLDEMIDVLYGDKKLGAVSPRSNNASIATLPLWSAVKKGIEPDKSYAFYKSISPKMPRYTIAPVVHGFCMLIRRQCIKKYGLFDPIFGKGYGEEVDFCLRIAQGGWLVAFCNHAYVFHMEARSFGSEQKGRLMDEHNKIIWQRYPSYRQAVRDYMEHEVPFEQSLEPTALLHPSIRIKRTLRKVIRYNPLVHKVAREVHRIVLGPERSR